jgi:ABC-2 type transport system permease protein
MAEQTRPAGSIYDLGYRSYDGSRLGRSYAVVSLYLYSLRAIFGLGRSAWAKVLAFGLAALASIPAVIQLAIAAIAPIEFELVRPEGHFTYVQIIIVLFCALAAPEIVGRDQRSHTLPLYFSRALSRVDYVLAKVGALFTALFVILLLPLVLLVIGIAVADEDLLGYLKDNLDLWPPIFASSFVIAMMMAPVSLAIASQTSRRAFSTGAVFGYFFIATAIGNILVETLTGDARMYAVLVSPLATLVGTVYWLFGVTPPTDGAVDTAGLEGFGYMLASLAYTAVAMAVLLRRFLRMSV